MGDGVLVGVDDGSRVGVGDGGAVGVGEAGLIEAVVAGEVGDTTMRAEFWEQAANPMLAIIPR